MTGYSGTPLLKKLGITDELKLLILNPPPVELTLTGSWFWLIALHSYASQKKGWTLFICSSHRKKNFINYSAKLKSG